VAASYPTRLFSGSYAPLANRGFGHGRSIYYCHTPPRFLYDLRDHYQASFPAWQGPLLAALRRWLQPRYEAAVRSMDVVLANSRNVQRRLQDYLGVASRVVYPPVDTDRFQWLADDGYFLSTARLEPLKRVDMLVRAFKRMPSMRLVVSSGGSELARLTALAADAPNIRFTGWLDDAQLTTLMGRARASIYVPLDEDFGMSPVESMAAGKPVIGVAEGGLLETVVDGETGILLPPQLTEDALVAAVLALDARRAAAMRGACVLQAQQFSTERFTEEITRVLRFG
jgi:glycosyltransferase involved in cell wall biosynthesis